MNVLAGCGALHLAGNRCGNNLIVTKAVAQNLNVVDSV